MTVAARVRRGVPTVLALGAWVGIIALAWHRAEPYRADWKLRGAPIAGFFDRHVSPATFLVLAFGLVLVRVLPAWCQRVGWRRLLVLAALAGLAWGSALAMTRPDGLERSLASRHEYPAVLPEVDAIGIGPFVRTYADETVLRTYPIHVQGHPVGATLPFVALDRVGLDGTGWATLLVLAIGATTTPAVLLTVREVGGDRGEHLARQVAPFLALAPAMVWAVVSMDSVFAAVGAWAIALMALASAPDRSLRQRAALGLGSGVLWGVGIHLSYGLPPIALVGLVVVALRRRWDIVGWVALGALAVTACFWAAGFWWFDGLAATQVRYHEGIAEVRPRRFFTFIGNPAAFGLAVGPALAVALVKVRDKALWTISGAALVAVFAANATGLSKAEVERIWLPFAPWVIVLAGGLADLPGRIRSFSPPWPALASHLLVAQVVLAVVIESVVKTPW